MRPILEHVDVDAEYFKEEILPKNRPVVLRGLVRKWPATQAALQSVENFCSYLTPFDRQIPAETFFGPPEIHGRFWYGPNMRGFNFERQRRTITDVLQLLLHHLNNANPPSIYAGSVVLEHSMPEFARHNSLSVIATSIQPRIWLGNRVTVQAHFDHSENLACVVSGRRRFTLFPPEQLKNLYIGPLDFTIAGQPISMASFHQPDFTQHPRFKDALDNAYFAELEAGDALYIPYMWWHHVESLKGFNALVNYWWDIAPPEAGAAFEALVHSIMAIRPIPAIKREAWKEFMNHYVFEDNGNPAAHLKENERGILHSMSPKLAGHIRNWLLKALSR